MHAPADDGLDLRVAFVVVVDERRGRPAHAHE
jgi:hypothetical protein